MQNTNFKFFEVVCDILNNWNTHNKQAELNLLDLIFKLLFRRFFKEFFNFLLLFFLLCEVLWLFLPFFYSIVNGFCYLRRNFFIAIVDDFDKESFTFFNSGVMIEHYLKHVTDDSFMINTKIDFEWVKLCNVWLNLMQDFLLPYGSNQQINNK